METEKATRMDGLRTKLGKALLKLMGFVLENKVTECHMSELMEFVEKFTEKVKFYQYMNKVYISTFLKHEKFFEALWFNKPYSSMTNGIHAITRYLDRYPFIKSWKTVYVEIVKDWSIEMVDDSYLLDYEYVLLMKKGEISSWKEPGVKMVDLVKILIDNGFYADRYDYIVKFDFDSEKRELRLIFLELTY